MRAGKLRQRVTIEQPDGSEDAYGSPTNTFEAWKKNVQVGIVSVAGGEAFRGMKVDATTTHAVTMRWIDGLTTAMRFDWDGRKLEILQIMEPDGRRREFNVTCKELTSG